MDVPLFYFASLSYLVAAAFAFAFLATRRLRTGRVATWVAGVGFVLHTLSLAARIAATGRAPVGNPYEVVSGFAWAVVLLYLLAEVRSRAHVAGAFVLPLVVLAMVAAAGSRKHFKAALGPALE